jgi:cold shock CspA family protein
MGKGTIKRLISGKRSGFIRTLKRGDVFFSFDELQGMDSASLKEGQRVELEVGQDGEGRLQALRVRPLQSGS